MLPLALPYLRILQVENLCLKEAVSMKGANKKILIAVLLILLAYNEVVLGGDSVSFSVSCTIPVIPGVNSPLIKEESIRTERDKKLEERTAGQNEMPQDSAVKMIQEENTSEYIEGSTGEKSIILVKTFYTP